MVTLALVMAALGADAAPKQAVRVVSPAWRTVQVPAELAEFYSDGFARALRAQGVKIVTASEVQALISQERQKQLLGCGEDSASCLAELASALGCDATLLANLALLGTTYRGNLKLISSTDGSVLAEAPVKASGQDELVERLDEAAVVLTKQLAARLGVTMQPAAGVAASSTGTKALWWIPAVSGGVVLAGGVGSLVGAGLEFERLSQQRGRGEAVTEGDIRTGATLQTLGWVGVGVGAAALVGAGLLAVFGSDAPIQPQVMLAPSGGFVGVAGVLP